MDLILTLIAIFWMALFLRKRKKYEKLFEENQSLIKLLIKEGKLTECISQKKE